mgnify:CR=1 FL=1
MPTRISYFVKFHIKSYISNAKRLRWTDLPTTDTVNYRNSFAVQKKTQSHGKLVI